MLTTENKRRVIRLSIISVVLYWLLGLSLIFVVPAFRDLFHSFGTSSPALTSIVINSTGILGTLAIGLYIAQIIGVLYSYSKAEKTNSYKQMFKLFHIAIAIGIALWIALAIAALLTNPLLNQVGWATCLHTLQNLTSTT